MLREGTDYGHQDFSLEEKYRAVRQALARGEAEIHFDPQTGTTDIRLREGRADSKETGHDGDN